LLGFRNYYYLAGRIMQALTTMRYDGDRTDIDRMPRKEKSKKEEKGCTETKVPCLVVIIHSSNLAIRRHASRPYSDWGETPRSRKLVTHSRCSLCSSNCQKKAFTFPRPRQSQAPPGHRRHKPGRASGSSAGEQSRCC